MPASKAPRRRASEDGETAQWRRRLRSQADFLDALITQFETEGADASWWLRRLADDESQRPDAMDFVLTLRWLQEVADRMRFLRGGVLDAAYVSTQQSWADLAVFGYTPNGTANLRRRYQGTRPGAPSFRARIRRADEPSAGRAEFVKSPRVQVHTLVSASEMRKADRFGAAPQLS